MKLKVKIGTKNNLELFSTALDQLILVVFTDITFLHQYNLIECKRKLQYRKLSGMWSDKRNNTLTLDLNTYNSLREAFQLYMLKNNRKYDTTAVMLSQTLSALEIKFDSFKQQFMPRLQGYRNEIQETLY